mmetsp:Transcript_81/g.171  ORF Transcript_81/g.171 Transcript_81/m.171 type:complete len:234 (+) Transcript_81:1328-2029(+)
MLCLQRLPLSQPLQLTYLPFLVCELHLQRLNISFASTLQVAALFTHFLLPTADHGLLSVPHCCDLCVHLGVPMADLPLGLNAQLVLSLLQLHLRFLERGRLDFEFLLPLDDLGLCCTQISCRNLRPVFTSSQLAAELSCRRSFLNGLALQVGGPPVVFQPCPLCALQLSREARNLILQGFSTLLSRCHLHDSLRQRSPLKLVLHALALNEVGGLLLLLPEHPAQNSRIPGLRG